MLTRRSLWLGLAAVAGAASPRAARAAPPGLPAIADAMEQVRIRVLLVATDMSHPSIVQSVALAYAGRASENLGKATTALASSDTDAVKQAAIAGFFAGMAYPANATPTVAAGLLMSAIAALRKLAAQV